MRSETNMPLGGADDRIIGCARLRPKGLACARLLSPKPHIAGSRSPKVIYAADPAEAKLLLRPEIAYECVNNGLLKKNSSIC